MLKGWGSYTPTHTHSDTHTHTHTHTDGGNEAARVSIDCYQMATARLPAISRSEALEMKISNNGNAVKNPQKNPHPPPPPQSPPPSHLTSRQWPYQSGFREMPLKQHPPGVLRAFSEHPRSIHGASTEHPRIPGRRGERRINPDDPTDNKHHQIK